MDTASKILVVGGLANLVWGFLVGFELARVRGKAAVAPRYLIFAHTLPVLQGPILLAMPFAVQLSTLSTGWESLAAWLLVASSALLDLNETLNWLRKVQDQFAPRTSHYILGAASAPISTAGIVILLVGAVRAL
jgi:hypothetical protein